MKNLRCHWYQLRWTALYSNQYRPKPTSNYIQKRFLNKKKLKLKTEGNIMKATEYFDNVYQGVYGEAWKSMKKSLKEENKYVAIINNYVDYQSFVEKLEEDGAFELGQFYNNTIKRHLCNNTKISGLDLKNVKYGTKDNLHTDISNENLVEPLPETVIAEKLNQSKEIFHTNLTEEPDENRKFDESSIGNVANYVQSSKFKGLEEWVEEKDVFTNIDESDVEIGIKKIVLQEPLKWPGILKAYSFILGDHSTFPGSHLWKSHGLYTHYLLNGSSILPVLALDLQPKDKVLDMCAGPGGKSLIMLQTGLTGYVESNDVSGSRKNRIINVMSQYIPTETLTDEQLCITQMDGRVVQSPGFFDKVLVDSPCLTDRTSLTENDNNIFKSSRVKERLAMPQLQAELIFSALEHVKIGGSVVYATCTLSPFQNDGAVYLALNRAWKESQIECTVVDLSNTTKHLRTIFKFGFDLGLRYGHIVLPTFNRNFGPMYFCKIIRDS